MSKRKTNKGPSQRQLRVGESLRHALAELLLRVEISDPDLEGIYLTVSEVRASPDLRNATVYVSPLGGKREPQVVAALNKHTKFIKGELAPRLELKYMPELKFELDSTYDEFDKINKLLHSPKVAQDIEKQ